MNAIEPGTPVRVVLDGIVEHVSPGDTFDLRTASGLYDYIAEGAGVQVVPLDPERPTLDRKSVTTIVEAALGHSTANRNCDAALRGADAVLALIKAAHPEWTP